MARKRTWTDEQLREAVATSTTYKGAMRKLGLRGSGAVHCDVRLQIQKLGLDTGHFAARASTWSDEQLREAIASSTSYMAALDKLGVERSGARYQQVTRRARQLGCETAHFIRARDSTRTTRTRWSDEQLRAAVSSSTSYAATIRELGLVPAGGNYDQVQRRIEKLGLDTSHFTGAGWNIGGKFQPRPALPLAEVLIADRWASSHSLKLRLFREGVKTERCERCGWAERRAIDGAIPLELDHHNGDRTDNRLENLRVLCPNCHALQPTHRGLNKRTNRRR